MILILTALELERAAVRRHLVTPGEQTHDGTVFDIGALRRQPTRRIALAALGKGNNGAAILTDRAIQVFNPTAVLFVGVAGALRDAVPLGDVVISNRIYAYHGGRVQSDEFLAHPRAYEVAHEVCQAVMSVQRQRSWLKLRPRNMAMVRIPEAHLEPIAAGEVVLNSLTSPEAKRIQHHYNDAVAVEMESAGVAHATHLNRGLPMAAIRGISDAASGEKDKTDGEGWQPIAAANAAAFAVALVGHLEDVLGPRTAPSTAEKPGQTSSTASTTSRPSTDGATNLTSNYNESITTFGPSWFGPQINQ